MLYAFTFGTVSLHIPLDAHVSWQVGTVARSDVGVSSQEQRQVTIVIQWDAIFTGRFGGWRDVITSN